MIAGDLLIAFTAVQRLFETFVSKRNVRALVAKGAQVDSQSHVWMMVLLHSAWLVACWLESHYPIWQPVFSTQNSRMPVVSIGLFLFLLGQFIRWWARATLAGRWTIPIVIQRGENPIRKGPFRWFRHPNYLGVALEILGLPLMLNAWVTALVASTLNAIVLTYRIRHEERAWRECAAA